LSAQVQIKLNFSTLEHRPKGFANQYVNGCRCIYSMGRF